MICSFCQSTINPKKESFSWAFVERRTPKVAIRRTVRACHSTECSERLAGLFDVDGLTDVTVDLGASTALNTAPQSVVNAAAKEK